MRERVIPLWRGGGGEKVQEIKGIWEREGNVRCNQEQTGVQTT